MENLFLFKFCLRDLFVKNGDAPSYARPIHGKGAIALGQSQLVRSSHNTRPGGQKVVERVYEFKNTRQVSNYKDADEREFSHYMKKIARVEIVPAREHLFRE